MLKKLISLVVSLGIICSLVVLPTGTAYAEEGTQLSYGVLDDQGRIHIQTAEHLKALAQESSQIGNPVNAQYQIFILDNDITLNDTYDEAINIAPNESDPFRGTFDGNGHTISGLRFSTHLIGTGLFKYTDSATIKNLNIYNANIYATYCGGIIAGIATNTKFINISIQDSYLKCIPGNVSLSLFSTGGMTVGALAGQAAENSLIYNCESINTVIESGEAQVGNVAGGSGSYFGGLVGSMNNSHIEYSRTLTLNKIDSGKISYKTVGIAGVLDFAYIYLGGICGEIKNGASIIDSFSNILMRNQPATAVSVITATYSYIGGISGAAYGDTTTIKRCHYSGFSEAWDFGGFLFSGTDKNRHLGGIVGRIGNTDTDTTDNPSSLDNRFVNCFYNYDRIMEGEDNPSIWLRPGRSAVAWRNGTLQVYHELTPNTCSSYTNKQYSDQANNWATKDYDFSGTIQRNTPCSELFGDKDTANHVNRWVMETFDYSTSDTEYKITTMPIHGTTTMEIYSNYHNAFTDEDADSMTYEYTINDDQTVNVPDSNSVSALVAKENTAYAGYIGLAFVSRNTTQQGTSYNCDYIYAANKVNENDETITNTVPLNIIQIYSSDPDKRIYAVWCQGKTIGGQLNLSGSSGIRVLTAVNTALLENIALDKPDDEYGRAVTFNDDATTKYLIKADSRAWYGEQYVEASGASAAKAEIPNAKVFSIYLYLDENEYNTEINAVGDILLNDSSAEGKFIDYMCGGSFKSSATKIAEAYFNDLMAGDYEISDDAFINLINYIPEIANEEIDMSSDMDFDQFDDVMPEAEAQAE